MFILCCGAGIGAAHSFRSMLSDKRFLGNRSTVWSYLYNAEKHSSGCFFLLVRLLVK